ncbi:hypothetical protein AB0H88_03805 [Nonomuraea sp. NPDC050680]|uniref:hypothetical protein n=1 Tax=Nonomuraea sp. NPDC050680 TaxID=3154630 RepID=UPI00340E83A1
MLSAHPDHLVYRRGDGQDAVLVAVNLSDRDQRIALPEAGIRFGHRIRPSTSETSRPTRPPSHFSRHGSLRILALRRMVSHPPYNEQSTDARKDGARSARPCRCSSTAGTTPRRCWGYSAASASRTAFAAGVGS